MTNSRDSLTISADYVRELLAAQGYPIAAEAAAAIAATLTIQLNNAAGAYGRLAFEVEPSGFSGSLNGGAAR